MPKVTELLPKDDRAVWSNEHGTFTTYAFKLEGVEKIVRWNRKHQNGAAPAGPQVGENLDGELEDKGNYLKFKKAQGGGGFGGGSRSPEEKKRIERMAAHKTGAHLLASAVELGLVDKSKVENKAGLMNLHRQIVDDLIGDLP